MQGKVKMAEIKTYSRKEIVAWVHSSGEFKFQLLKNGLFFIRILRKVLGVEVGKGKIYEKAKNDYEYTQNLNIVKKTLNKFGLQLNLNVPDIISSKNCFSLANWFKNFYDQNKQENDTEFCYSQKSFTPSKIAQNLYKSPASKVPSRANSSDSRNISGQKKKNPPIPDMQSTNILPSNFKSPKKVYALEGIDKHNLTMIAFKNGNEQKIQDKRKSMMVNRTSTNLPFNLNSTQLFTECQQINELKSIENIMKKQAIKGNICQFKKVLEKINNYISTTEESNIEVFQKKIRNLIYMKE